MSNVLPFPDVSPRRAIPAGTPSAAFRAELDLSIALVRELSLDDGVLALLIIDAAETLERDVRAAAS